MSETMIAAVVLAAGSSRRMGSPKMILPWGTTTVIGRVVTVLAQAGLVEIVVVTGGARRNVEDALAGLPARTVFNPRFEEDQMAFSLQAGLAALPTEATAALVALGDQPQIDMKVVDRLLAAYQQHAAPLVFPSYRRQRGHPWIVARQLWYGIMALEPPATLRDFVRAHEKHILYVNVDSDTIFRDLDTPGDYQRERPETT
jgi:molybdenum cofactor cytidylyltransferase